jgi:hypothetical protein
VISEEIASTLARFFDYQRGPSHDDLSRLFRRCGLEDADPRVGSRDPVGKKKRVRDVLAYAAANNRSAGSELVKSLLARMRACGCFRPGSENYPGDDAVQAAQEAFAREGYSLGTDGAPTPRLLDNLEGAELTEALWVYVRRVRDGAADPALVVGTNKDLVEATARHVLVETLGFYQPAMNFPGTLYQAFEQLRLAMPPSPDVDLVSRLGLESDPRRQVEQLLYLLACAANRLRNKEGVGHGRPSPSSASPEDAAITSQISGLVSELLLRRMTPKSLVKP